MLLYFLLLVVIQVVGAYPFPAELKFKMMSVRVVFAASFVLRLPTRAVVGRTDILDFSSLFVDHPIHARFVLRCARRASICDDSATGTKRRL